METLLHTVGKKKKKKAMEELSNLRSYLGSICISASLEFN